MYIYLYVLDRIVLVRCGLHNTRVVDALSSAPMRTSTVLGLSVISAVVFAVESVTATVVMVAAVVHIRVQGVAHDGVVRSVGGVRGRVFFSPRANKRNKLDKTRARRG